MGSTEADALSPGKLRVLIVGAGIGGLTAAIALRQQGHRVEVSCIAHARSLQETTNPTSYSKEAVLPKKLEQPSICVPMLTVSFIDWVSMPRNSGRLKQRRWVWLVCYSILPANTIQLREFTPTGDHLNTVDVKGNAAFWRYVSSSYQVMNTY